MDRTLCRLVTEQCNPRTAHFDELSTLDMLRMINWEDAVIAPAIAEHLGALAQAIDLIAKQLQSGGRLFYVGAGNGGRLALMDGRECPPTFNTPPEMVQTILAGGPKSVFDTVEGAEDNEEDGFKQIDAYGVTTQDVIFALTASGRTPFVLGAVRRAREKGVPIVAFSNNRGAELSKLADLAVEIEVGPEVIQGSTRLKAGTAQKMVMNMVTTCVMAKLGKVYRNMMVDMVPTNYKLEQRALLILQNATGADEEAAKAALDAAGGKTKEAIVMLMIGCESGEASARLASAGGYVTKAVTIKGDAAS